MHEQKTAALLQKRDDEVNRDLLCRESHTHTHTPLAYLLHYRVAWLILSFVCEFTTRLFTLHHAARKSPITTV